MEETRTSDVDFHSLGSTRWGRHIFLSLSLHSEMNVEMKKLNKIIVIKSNKINPSLIGE